jgi:hypothetical protein
MIRTGESFPRLVTLEGVFEVEFSDNEGRSYALVPLRSEQLLVLHHQVRPTRAYG